MDWRLPAAACRSARQGTSGARSPHSLSFLMQAWKACSTLAAQSAKLRHSGLKRPGCEFFERLGSQLFGQNFNAPRARISSLQHQLNKAFHIKLTFATQPAVIDRIFVKTPWRFEGAVVEFDAGYPVQWDAGYFVIRNFQLHDVPKVERNAAIGRARTLDHLE